MIDGLSSSETRPSLAAYRTVARNLPDTTVLMFDRNLRYLLAEGQALPILGFSTNRAIGYTLREALPALEADLFEPRYRAALAGLESRMPRQYGGSIYDIRIHPARDDDGVVFAGMVICQEVTLQHQTIASLHESEHRNRILLETMPDYMVVLDREGRVIDQSPSSLERFGMPDVLAGVNLRDVGLPNLLVRQMFGLIEATLRTKTLQTVIVETNHFEPNGIYELRGVCLNASQVMIMVRTLTALYLTRNALQNRMEELVALREIEAKLADTLEIDRVLNVGFEAVMAISGARDGALAMFNDAHKLTIHRVMGMTDAETLDGLIQRGMGIAGRVVRTGQAEFTPDVRAEPAYHAIAQDIVSQITIPLQAHNRPIGLLLINTPILGRLTEDTYRIIQILAGRIAVALDNALLHTQLKRQHDQIRELERLKTEMLKLGAHDLRNPLTIVANYLNMLETQARSTGQDAMLEPILEIGLAAQRMRSIADDILDAERAELMLTGILTESLDFNVVLSEAVKVMRPIADLKHHTYETNWPIEVMIGYGDNSLLVAAASNLISNAVKYTPEAGVINIKLSQRDHRAYFEVTDNGFGIPAKAQTLLFEPMHRANTKETRNIEGTGFGLYLVKLIVQRHGGDVFFTSTYHKGSTFGFWLPLAD